MKKKKKTVVIFRKGIGAEEEWILALFPELQATLSRDECLSYMTVGQHGSASYRSVLWTKPAKPEEYASLKEELESIGYDLIVRKKISKRWYEI
jgi:hypothetical protein